MVSTKLRRVRLEAIQDILTAVQRIVTAAEAGRVPLRRPFQVNMKYTYAPEACVLAALSQQPQAEAPVRVRPRLQVRQHLQPLLSQQRLKQAHFQR